jgi:hypothetical protein
MSRSLLVFLLGEPYRRALKEVCERPRGFIDRVFGILRRRLSKSREQCPLLGQFRTIVPHGLIADRDPTFRKQTARAALPHRTLGTAVVGCSDAAIEHLRPRRRQYDLGAVASRVIILIFVSIVYEQLK